MAYCDNCEDETAREREQVAKFIEDVDAGTDVQDWGMLIYDRCLECDTVHVDRRDELGP